MARTCYFKISRAVGGSRQYTNGGVTTVTAGTMVKLNVSDTECIAGITVADIAASATGMIYDAGIVSVPCGAAQSFSIGEIIVWDNSESAAIPYASRNDDDDFVIGTCYKATAGTTVEVDLNNGPKEFYRNSFSSSPSTSTSSSPSTSVSSSPSTSASTSVSSSPSTSVSASTSSSPSTSVSESPSTSASASTS